MIEELTVQKILYNIVLIMRFYCNSIEQKKTGYENGRRKGKNNLSNNNEILIQTDV